jgi:predicted Zn-dependent peptidase
MTKGIETGGIVTLPPVAYRAATLDNGLRVIAIPQPQLHQAHVALYVRVGSRFETPASNGISHFLEHMIYRGTERLPSAHAVNLAFEELGGYLYASTQSDYGVFSLTLPPESLDAACALFGEVLAAPAFRDIEVEQGIVCEEILEDLDDDGRQVDPDNLSRALIYPTHPLGFTITGSEQQVRSFDAAALRAHHARHYTAENCALVLSGDVDAGRSIDLAARVFGGFPRGERVVADPPEPTQKKARVKYVESVASQTDLRVCLRAVGDNAPERAAVDFLMRVIDDGMSTRLYHRICDDKGLCYDVSGGFDGYEDDGVLDISAGVQHSRAVAVTREILAMFSELAEAGPTDDEIAKAKRRYAWDMRGMLDSAEEIGSFFGVGTLFQRFDPPEARLDSMLKVSRDDVHAAARLVAQGDRLNVVGVGVLSNSEAKRLAEVAKSWRTP